MWRRRCSSPAEFVGGRVVVVVGDGGVVVAEQLGTSGVDPHREIVVCSVSARRAIPAAEQLRRLGYERVHYLAGGYSAWHHRGR